MLIRHTDIEALDLFLHMVMLVCMHPENRRCRGGVVTQIWEVVSFTNLYQAIRKLFCTLLVIYSQKCPYF